MPLYSDYPSLIYRLKQKNIQIRDITRRVAFRNDIKDTARLFLEYNVRDGERPEDIAFRLYGSPQYHWIVLYMNDIVDPYNDWPKSDKQILRALTEQFGTLEEGISESNIHHWETPDGYVIPNDGDLRENGDNDNIDVGAMSISWYNWAVEQNENKRRIKLLSTEFLPDVLEEVDTLLKQRP